MEDNPILNKEGEPIRPRRRADAERIRRMTVWES